MSPDVRDTIKTPDDRNPLSAPLIVPVKWINRGLYQGAAQTYDPQTLLLLNLLSSTLDLTLYQPTQLLSNYDAIPVL